MPNIGGPRSSRRVLYAYVVDSILLYGAPIWSCATKTQAYIRQAESVYRRACLRVISGRPHVCYDATYVIAGIPPLALLADERARIYQRCPEDVKEEERRETLNRWQDRKLLHFEKVHKNCIKVHRERTKIRQTGHEATSLRSALIRKIHKQYDTPENLPRQSDSCRICGGDPIRDTPTYALAIRFAHMLGCHQIHAHTRLRLNSRKYTRIFAVTSIYALAIRFARVREYLRLRAYTRLRSDSRTYANIRRYEHMRGYEAS
ncbi:unnamed protein product [Trichogramma brassicae]|uniref:Reverse transcriptase n=1 Tax=Trichogramma brassicae TaxID=86971 RepID=A0A6H5I4D8_9HYME|nr:unnamed protein product [Trichogramma brassicae]